MWKNSFKLAFTFVGTLVGAGFASGREVAAFFGETSVFGAVVSGLLTGALSFVFMELGRLSKGDIIGGFFGKAAFFWETLIRIINFVTLAAMLAGAEFAFKELTGASGGGILLGLLALLVVLGGAQKIALANCLTVPLMLGLILFLTIKNEPGRINGKIFSVLPLLYVFFNCLSAGLITAKVSVSAAPKEIFAASVLIGVSLSALLLMMRFAVNRFITEEMPVLSLSASLGLKFIGSAFILIAVFTSIAGCILLSSNKYKWSSALVLGLAFLLSHFGFSSIVNYAYPVIGWAGALFTGALLVIAAVDSAKRRKAKYLTSALDI